MMTDDYWRLAEPPPGANSIEMAIYKAREAVTAYVLLTGKQTPDGVDSTHLNINSLVTTALSAGIMAIAVHEDTPTNIADYLKRAAENVVNARW